MGLQRELEITVLSATNLKRRYGLGSTNPSYAVLWIDSHSKAPTPIANRSPSGNNHSFGSSVIRMLCKQSLFGTAAKAKLFIEVFHDLEVAGTAHLLLSELQVNLVWGEESAPASWSEPKRVTLDIRRLRAGSNQKEKVIGKVDIQVRVERTAWNRMAEVDAGRVIYYQGLPTQVERGEFVPRDSQCFEEKSPAPLIQKAEASREPVYYQHACVEKPKAVWKGINDQPGNGRVGVLAMGALF